MTIAPALAAAFFLGLALLAAVGVPLAAAVSLAGAALLAVCPELLAEDFFLDYSLAMRLNSPALISIPLFALAGELAVAAGITRKLLDVTDAFFGRGFHAVGPRAIVGCTLFASVSGVGPAAVKAEGRRLYPDLLEAGFSREIASGAIACAAGLSIIIPASIPLTVYAAATGTLTNIVFTASFVPGIVMAGALLAAMAVHSRLRLRHRRDGGTGDRTVARALWEARWAALLPILVLSFLLSGFLQAPEAAAFASAYAFVYWWRSRRRHPAGKLREAVVRAGLVAGTVVLMAGIGGLFVLLLSTIGFTDALTDFLFRLGGGPFGAIFLVNVILLAAGCFFDMPAIITLIVPVFLPLAERSGLTVPHFGAMVVVNLAIGLVTPPQAWNIAAVSEVTGVDRATAARGVAGFLPVMLFVLALVAYVPELSLWLPRLLGWDVG
ncbi:MAG: TRAP transporter large permease subunit [Planctomycetaceae bacterium]|nr:TRAP transporter large permease subunit [Planctomycetaceae bacterium]